MDHEQLRFYWTVACGSTRKAIRIATNPDEQQTELKGTALEGQDVPDPEYAMLSFATKNNIPFEGPTWMIDSGGYSTLHNNGCFEASIDEYVDYLEEYEDRIDRYVLRDWACEPDLLREQDRNVRTHQNWTIRDHVECQQAVESRGLEMEPVAVLQGYDLQEYLRHFDYLREHGLLTDHLGIGSICRRGKESEIQSLIPQLRQEIPDRITLHGFGVKATVLDDPTVVEALDSVDSNAWDNSVSRDPSVSNAWDNVLGAYRKYYRDIKRRLDVAQENPDQAEVRSLSEFLASPPRDEKQTVWPLARCVCGTLVDPNDLSFNEPGCRHCERGMMRLEMAAEGLRCEPETDTHHPLCPHNVDDEPEPSESEGAATAPA